MTRPFVLGIPRCNEPDWIFRETLAAIVASSVKPEYLIIVDNGDNALVRTSAVDDLVALSNLFRVELSRSTKNTGCAGAWNWICGRALSLGDYANYSSAILLNSDCAVAPDTFEKMLAEPSEIVLAHGWECFRFDRTIWEHVGRFDEEYYPVYFEDTDYRRRLNIASVPVSEWPVVEVSRPSFGRATYSTGITHGWRLEEAGYQGWTGEKAAWFQSRWVANRDRYTAKWGGPPGEEKFTTPFGQ